MQTIASVIPDLIRYPASPSPWAEKTLFAAQTRVGWMPDQATVDDQANAGSVLAMALRIVTS
ncbi:hypothetical protein OLQ21_25055, partial [Agrobacterium sp. MAFF210268]